MGMRVKRTVAALGGLVLAAGLAGCDLGEAPTKYDVNPGADIPAGDVDGDGDLDLVTTHWPDHLAVLRNDGSGHFTPEISPFDYWEMFMHLGDVDHDGDADLVFHAVDNDPHPTGAGVYLQLADGSGGFGPAVRIDLQSASWSHSLLGDADGDGNLDVVVVNGNPGLAFVRFGDGTGQFGERVPLPSAGPVVPDEMLLTDLNHDSRADLVLAGLTPLFTPIIDVLPADPTQPSGFAPPVRLTKPGINAFIDIVAGDFDEDGHPDLLAGDRNALPPDLESSSLFLGDGTGHFGAPLTVPSRGHAWSLESGDIDSDRHLDLVITNTAFEEGPGDNGFVLYGDGTGHFPRSRTLDEGPARVAVHDLDADGRPDVVAYLFSNDVTVYLNRT